MFPKVVIEHRSTALGAFWNAFTVFAMSLPAAVVWFTISMLKGDAYSVGIDKIIFRSFNFKYQSHKTKLCILA